MRRRKSKIIHKAAVGIGKTPVAAMQSDNKDEKIFFFIQRVINFCDHPEHIQICKNLLKNLSKKRKGATDKLSPTALNELSRALKLKSNTVRQRLYQEKRNKIQTHGKI